jgi:hypothetical protein
LPELLTEDQALLKEFFVDNPVDETARLKEEIRRQQWVIDEGKATILELQSQITDPVTTRKWIHHGPGEGERYNPVPKGGVRTPKKKPPKRLQSVVKVVRRILPKPRQNYHRSPLQDLFRPDVPRDSRDHRRKH